MKARDFCFWLQGYFELNQNRTEPMTDDQEAMIKTHLALVFKHDPEFTGMEHPLPKYVTYDEGVRKVLENGNVSNLGRSRRTNTNETLLC